MAGKNIKQAVGGADSSPESSSAAVAAEPTIITDETPTPALPPTSEPEADTNPPPAPLPTEVHDPTVVTQSGHPSPDEEPAEVRVMVLVKNLGPKLYHRGDVTDDPAIVALLDDGTDRVIRVER
jgi:hypothetical protein